LTVLLETTEAVMLRRVLERAPLTARPDDNVQVMKERFSGWSLTDTARPLSDRRARLVPLGDDARDLALPRARAGMGPRAGVRGPSTRQCMHIVSSLQVDV
jgi:hypothetical protein